MFAGPGLGLGRLAPEVVVHEEEAGEGDRESDMRLESAGGTANPGCLVESAIPLARDVSGSMGWVVLAEKRAELRRR
jgi:hypothetical protein